MGRAEVHAEMKEMIGLGISAATRCRYCTLFHTEAAKLFGAIEDDFADEVRRVVDYVRSTS